MTSDGLLRRILPDGRHVRFLPGQVPAAECLLAQDGADGRSHADSHPQRAQCFPVEPGVGDRFPGRVQSEGAGPEEIRGFLEACRLEHGIADRVVAGEANRRRRVAFAAEERSHGIGEIPPGRADAAHARDGDRGDAHRDTSMRRRLVRVNSRKSPTFRANRSQLSGDRHSMAAYPINTLGLLKWER